MLGEFPSLPNSTSPISMNSNLAAVSWAITQNGQSDSHQIHTAPSRRPHATRPSRQLLHQAVGRRGVRGSIQAAMRDRMLATTLSFTRAVPSTDRKRETSRSTAAASRLACTASAAYTAIPSKLPRPPSSFVEPQWGAQDDLVLVALAAEMEQRIRLGSAAVTIAFRFPSSTAAALP